MATVEIETHGCKLNTADSQQMAAEFLRAGFEVRSRENSNPPDVFILNSCTVTHVADKKARQAISAAKRRYPNALTVMTGCYPERAADETASLHSVDMVLGNRGKATTRRNDSRPFEDRSHTMFGWSRCHPQRGPFGSHSSISQDPRGLRSSLRLLHRAQGKRAREKRSR